MPNLTIRDIARMAGVSTTAVSFVLNNRSGVSDATREKVQEVIRQTGFTPNVHTRRLNLGKSFTIHVVLRQYDYSLFNQFALETLTGIFNASKELGYSIMFTFVDDEMNIEQVIESVRSKDCDGVILNQISDPVLISLLRQENIPFVCVDAHIKKDGQLPLVEVDYQDAAYQATQYLIRNGHRQIGFIGLADQAEHYTNTFCGYSSALSDNGLSAISQWIYRIRVSEEAVRECIHALLQQPRLPTALLCAGDSFAIDVVRFLKESGIKIPEDISIISLDDLLVSRYLDPPLSSMTFDKELLGEKAVQLLYQIMQQQDYSPINLIKTHPVERQSVKQLY